MSTTTHLTSHSTALTDAPNMNMVRDPRWGRAQEVYSEDPALSSGLTYNFITGAQGNASTNYQLTVACCKHYAA